jgi:hypothetical protein
MLGLKKSLCLFLNFEDEPLMSCRLYTFQAIQVNFVKAYSRTVETFKTLGYVLPVHRSLLEYGRDHSGTILESVIQWF